MHTTLLATLSLDGFIAPAVTTSSAEWTSKEDLVFFKKKSIEIGTVIMGSKTFETIRRPLKDRRIIVLARDPKTFAEYEKKGVLEFVNKTPKEVLSWLEQQGVNQVVIAGGGQVYSHFLKEDLVDELFLTYHPIVFGQGVPFAAQSGQKKFLLVSTDRLGEEAVLMHFRKPTPILGA